MLKVGSAMPTIDLKTFAYTSIKEKLLHCDYEPGSVLNETALCEELKISRTPIREALNRLSQENLIQILPKKGILVSSITITDVREMYQARKLLEPFIVKEAGPRLTKKRLLEFKKRCEKSIPPAQGFLLGELDTNLHMYLADSCGNKFLTDTMHKLWDQNTRIQFYSNDFTRFDSAQGEHIELLDALLDGQFDQAADIMKRHVENCMNCSFQRLTN